MPGDPTVPPSPARLSRAHRAGLRPGVGTWALAATAAAFTLAAPLALARFAPWAAGWWRAAFAGQAPPSVGLSAAALLAPAGLALAATLVVALAARNLAPVDRRARAQLGARPGREVGAAAVVLAVLATAGVGALLVGALAGAARAPGASPAGLLALWSTWGARALVGLAAVAVPLGWGLRRLEAARIRRALFQTVEQARQDARGSGGRRR